MTPKEAHEVVRAFALACPCCGQPVGLTAGDENLPDDAAINQLAADFIARASVLRRQNMVQLHSVEELAERLVSGLTKVWTS